MKCIILHETIQFLNKYSITLRNNKNKKIYKKKKKKKKTRLKYKASGYTKTEHTNENLQYKSIYKYQNDKVWRESLEKDKINHLKILIEGKNNSSFEEITKEETFKQIA